MIIVRNIEQYFFVVYSYGHKKFKVHAVQFPWAHIEVKQRGPQLELTGILVIIDYGSFYLNAAASNYFRDLEPVITHFGPCCVFSSVSDPNSGVFWIRIRNPDPDPEA